jgi:hypothetical protein
MVYKRRLFLAIVSGAVMIGLLSGCSGGFKYDKYVTKDPMLGLRVEYLKGWLHGESRGSKESYAEVFFGEPPKDKSASFKPFMSIVARNASSVGIAKKDLSGVADAVISDNIKIHRASEIPGSKTAIKLPAGDAIESTFNFDTFDRIYTVGNKKIKVTEKQVVLLKGSKVYILSYRNKQEDFDKYSKAFRHFVKSVRFQ